MIGLDYSTNNNRSKQNNKKNEKFFWCSFTFHEWLHEQHDEVKSRCIKNSTVNLQPDVLENVWFFCCVWGIKSKKWNFSNTLRHFKLPLWVDYECTLIYRMRKKAWKNSHLTLPGCGMLFCLEKEKRKIFFFIIRTSLRFFYVPNAEIFTFLFAIFHTLIFLNVFLHSFFWHLFVNL